VDERDSRGRRTFRNPFSAGSEQSLTALFPGAVRDYTGIIASIVFLDLENNLHQIREPMSAIFVKIPPSDYAARPPPSDSPISGNR